jgi:tRNA nucleotidyltransferase (CCA-adding enzyme)
MADTVYDWIVVTHDRSDFDALGSQIAAALLYPNSAILLAGKLAGPVREFFVLYQDSFGVVVRLEPPPSASRLVVVDTQSPNSLGKWREWVLKNPWEEVHLYDHHLRDADRMRSTVEVIEERGATVSLLLDRIRERHLDLTPEQATALAIALYTDTGNFVFPQTTARDLEHAAYLLGAGADPDLLRRFTAMHISPPQQRTLEILLESVQTYRIFDQRVTFGHIAMDEKETSDLSIVASKMFELLQPGVLILMFQFPESVLVIGRSAAPGASLSPVWEAFGGGGHSSAGSARVKDADVATLRFRILELLDRILPRPLTAWDIMSFPVRAVTEDATVQEANAAMARYGHGGLVVYDRNRALAGVITRKDTDRAVQHRLARQPVRRFMSRPVVTVTSDASLEDLRRTLVGRNIGRLPVVSDSGEVIGVVTRNDVIRAELAAKTATIEADMLSECVSRMAPGIPERLKAIGGTAQSLGFTAYLVGGPVRDLLMGTEVKDYDIVVEGDAGLVAEHLCVDAGCVVQRHGQFGTASVVFPDGLRVDLATAREEYYPAPGDLPTVEPANITADLRRRDFTVNGIALCIGPSSFGRIVDPYDGVSDVRARRLRVFHTLSFIEDATRILRAVRYRHRLGFALDSHTERLLRSAVGDRLLRKISGDRVRAELERTFEEPLAAQMLMELDDAGILDSFYRGWRLEQSLFAPENQVLAVLARFPEAHRNTLYFLAVAHHLSPHTATKVFQSLRLQRSELKAAALMSERDTVVAKVRSASSPSRTYSALAHLPGEFVYYLYLIAPSERASIELFLSHLRSFRLKVSGEDLIRQGAVAGPRLGRALKQTLYLRLDGRIREEDELTSALRLYYGEVRSERPRRSERAPE